ncbi:hypothetical protein [Sulfitobacter pacificus]|uniref:Uncharacterized protein n=1 Tax=Sulfitobacter pacificus TaxID=1499314 RepID=A0ABQ5VGD4_9RHOB|nr:hypothetical protein [Sulfitobacter pacificus]GLQ26149.1 hypothetical protein GCM10007927_09520 [Sulfitobacter pacificus]
MNTFKLYLIASLIGAVFATIGWAYIAGGKGERVRSDLNNAKDYIEGRQDAQDSQTDLPADDAGNIEWLLRPWPASD